MARTEAVRVDPIVLQIVEGTLHSVEAEVEAAMDRTGRSAMIPEQHDFRAGLPDLTTTVPVFHEGRVVCFVQAFGHHDDIGGMVPGSMPAHATSAFQEGLMIPPVRLFSQGVRNEGLYRVIVRNSRTPESFAGDLDSEVAACQMGARRMQKLFDRHGTDTVEACFEALIR